MPLLSENVSKQLVNTTPKNAINHLLAQSIDKVSMNQVDKNASESFGVCEVMILEGRQPAGREGL